MLIPSIDLMGGRIVQLVQGQTLKLAFDDFDYWIDRFQKYPLVQLIDLDAAMRQGSNADLIQQFTSKLPCQVGGGLRTADDGQRMLDRGAHRVIYGSTLFGGENEPDRKRHPILNLAFAENPPQGPHRRKARASPSTPRPARSPSKAGRSRSTSPPKKPSPGSKTTAPPSSTPTSTPKAP